MNVSTYIASLVRYGLDHGLFEPCDVTFITNQLLQALSLDSWEPAEAAELPLEQILKGLLDDAVARGVCGEDVTSRDLLDTRLMGVLTPLPREVQKKFSELYGESPEAATDWYYRFSQDTDYIRRYRITKDVRWKTATDYGNLDITINLRSRKRTPRPSPPPKARPSPAIPSASSAWKMRVTRAG